MSKILVLPGWTYSEEKMLPLIAALQKEGLAVNLLSIPGLTGKKLDQAWTLADYTDWLDKEIARLEPKQKKITLIGHSNGGRIILAYLVDKKRQKKVDRAILIGSAGLIDKNWQKVIKKKIGLWLAKIGKNWAKNEKIRKIFYKILREKDYYQASPVMKQTMTNLVNTDLRPLLSTIDIPISLLWGSEDKITPPYLAREMVQLLPQAKLEIIKNARHAPQFSHLSETLSFIKASLEGMNGQI